MAPPPGLGAVQATPTPQQLDLPKPDPATAAPRIRVEADAAVPTAPCPLANYDIQVQIRSIDFVGPSVLSEGGQPSPTPLAPEIRTLLADIASATPPGSQPVKIVCDIRDKAAARLRAAGYVASVQIPPQRIEDGALRLEVVTAKIVEVRVRGDAGPYRDVLAARIEQLKALTPLNERDAERVLLLAGDIPGLDVQLALRPANAQPGEVIGELTVVYKRFSLLANVQNYGSRQLGRETGYVRGELYGLTGAADVTYVGASSTFDFQEQIVAQAGHIMGLGSSGTTLAGSFTYAWSRPDVGELDLRSQSLIGGIELRMPITRSVNNNASMSGGFELIEQRTRVHANGSSSPLNRDKLRVAFLRMEASAGERRPDGADKWFLRGEVEVRQGLNVLKASRRAETKGGYTPSRFEGDPQASVVRGELDGIVGLGPIFSLYAGARAQYSSGPLLNFEEYSLGNLTFGRGYDPGANSADRAVAVRIEPRAKIFQSSEVRTDLFGFYDLVYIRNLDSNAIENRRTLDSFGGGLRIGWANRLLAEITYARPRDKALLIPGAKRAPDRLLLSITGQFSPTVK
ncbi:ShlB/FhaC/HecB family hemolysin secretion/activation protein [Sphingomonas jatrophae]|uniref:ShlB/FhaC/HecB family hemolysin secretion/activation protein n=1 Tax=Sphingomonas jatrophae TaxID=1166337 RepID=UPI0010426A70|nr:ShlB/FhaC/HecB family hemolysin secretion/activation protein [Sphingomonas jatrophae]